MNKRYLALLPILILALASCRPIYTDSSSEETSSVDTSNEVTSEDISSYSETTSHEHSSEEGTSEGQTSDTTSEATTSEETTSETTSEETTSETISEEQTSEEQTSEEPSSEEPTSEEPTSEEHQHEYSDEWTYDDNEHWHECLDPDCHERKDVAPHSYTSEVIKEPTYTETGIRRYTCLCGKYYDEPIPVKEHHYASTWSYDENTHWHACTDAGFENLKKDEAPHSFGAPTFKEEKDYMTYKKGINTYSCSCGYSKQETVYYTKAEMAELMNDFIKDKEYFDVFEMRDDLIKESFPILDFEYDLENEEIVIDNPSNTALMSFKQTNVSTLAGLKNAISEIANGADYSVIKLTADIDVSKSIVIDSAKPIQINLDNHLLNNLQEDAPAIRVEANDSNNKSVVVISNGIIQTPNLVGYYLEKRSSCVMVIGAESVRISNMKLYSRAERGYAYIDYPDSSSNVKVLIEDSTITAKLVAICIQSNNNIIDSNYIQGVVVVNSGKTSITNNIIDVTNIQKGMDNEANRLMTCSELYNITKDVYLNKAYDGYMMTATDPILIYDRRSVYHTYPSPEVTISGNTLRCKLGDDNEAYGYGIRYMDLAFDSNITENSYSLNKIIIGDNTYSYCQEEPFMSPGGYYIFEA